MLSLIGAARRACVSATRWILVACAALGAVGSAPAALGQCEPFVTVQNGQLYRGQRPFRVKGANYTGGRWIPAPVLGAPLPQPSYAIGACPVDSSLACEYYFPFQMWHLETFNEAAIEAAQEADYVTFTSSSTVTNLTEALGESFPRGARVVSIGPVTSESVRAAGLEVDVEAERHDVDGLLQALLDDAS